MAPPLDLKTLRPALGIAQRLSIEGRRPEGLSVVRELLAGLVDSKQFAEIVDAWFVPGLESPPFRNITKYSSKLTAISETLAASGYTTDAVRVMATCMGLDATIDDHFKALLAGISRPLLKPGSAKDLSEDTDAAVIELAEVGMDILKSGNPGGIALIGVAHHVAPQVRIHFSDIAASFRKLPDRQPASLQTLDAQALTEIAYDFHFRGREESAARVGTLVPALLSRPVADKFFSQLEFDAKPGTEEAFRTTRKILDKGYAAEAVNLLIDSNSVSNVDVWTSLDKAVIRPSRDLKTPSRVNFYTRSIWRSIREETLTRLPSNWVPVDAPWDTSAENESADPVSEPSAADSESQTTAVSAAPSPKRNLNASIDDPKPSVGSTFYISINIGVPKDTAIASQRFADLDWHGADFIDLMVALSSIDCDVEPSWHKLKLPRTGDSDTVSFAVTTNVPGAHEFTIRTYLAKQMIQLQSLSFTVTVATAQALAARG